MLLRTPFHSTLVCAGSAVVGAYALQHLLTPHSAHETYWWVPCKRWVPLPACHLGGHANPVRPA